MVLMVLIPTRLTLVTTLRHPPDQPHQQPQQLQHREQLLDVPQQIHNHRRHLRQMQQTTVSEAKKYRFLSRTHTFV